MKKYLLILIPVIIILSAIFAARSLISNKPVEEEVIPTPSVVLPTVSDTVKVNVLSNDNKRAVSIEVSGIPEDVESIDYELIYQTASGLARGVNGNRKVSDLPLKDITLGSCSTGGKCTYDEGVASVDLVLKFNSPNGASIYRNTFPI